MLIQLPVAGSWVRVGDVVGVFLKPNNVVVVSLVFAGGDGSESCVTIQCDDRDQAVAVMAAIGEAVNEALAGGP